MHQKEASNPVVEGSQIFGVPRYMFREALSGLLTIPGSWLSRSHEKLLLAERPVLGFSWILDRK